MDPGHAATFDRQRAALTTALQPYHDRIAAIRGQSAGRKVGATENIFVYLADALGLDLISPPEFMQAVAEGTDPPASTVAEFQQQVSEKQIGVLVVNTQTTTAVTTNLKQLAVGAGIPVVGISETLQPVGASFQAWQNQQLPALQAALSRAQRAMERHVDSVLAAIHAVGGSLERVAHEFVMKDAQELRPSAC